MKKIFQSITKRTLRFGLAGGIGALLMAVIFEPLIHLLPKAPEKEKVDIVFVLDVSNSMSDEIEGVKNGVDNFVNNFLKKDIDVKIGLVGFRDKEEDKNKYNPIEILSFDGNQFTNDYSLFAREMQKLNALGGGDTPESSLDALSEAANLNYRKNSIKILILITDAPPRIPDVLIKNMSQLHTVIETKGIKKIHLVVKNEVLDYFKPLLSGNFYSLSDISKNGKGLEDAMPHIGKNIAETLQGGGYDADYSIWMYIIFTFWGGLLGIGIASSLVVAQNIYLKKGYLLGAFKKTFLNSLLMGLVFGISTQIIYIISIDYLSSVSKIICWCILGLGTGGVVSKTVPNYPIFRALVGGGIGGILGGLFFSILEPYLHDLYLRLSSAFVIGFFIGLMISLIEEIMRNAWLTIEWNSNEKTSISLGEKPIIIGSSYEADVRLPKDKLPIEAILYIKSNKVFVENKRVNKILELKDKNTVSISGIKMVVNTLLDTKLP